MNSFTLSFENAISHKNYDELKRRANKILPGKLIFPELPFPDEESIYIYNNIIVFICRSYFHSMHQSAGIINTDMGFEAKIIHVDYMSIEVYFNGVGKMLPPRQITPDEEKKPETTE